MAAKTRKTKLQPSRSAADGDDTVVTALELPAAELTPAMRAYFDKCMEKLGFVPNVLAAYAFDMAKLEAFVAIYNDLMLAPSGLSKLEREMIAVAVSSENRCYYCLTAHGAAVRALSGDPVLGELMVMNYRAARLDRRQRAMLDLARRCANPASPTATSGILPRWWASSICRTGSPPRPTCAPIRSIMARRAASERATVGCRRWTEIMHSRSGPCFNAGQSGDGGCTVSRLSACGMALVA
jgi:uncharacterized peroxidase-related enzyme